MERVQKRRHCASAYLAFVNATGGDLCDALLQQECLGSDDITRFFRATKEQQREMLAGGVISPNTRNSVGHTMLGLCIFMKEPLETVHALLEHPLCNPNVAAYNVGESPALIPTLCVRDIMLPVAKMILAHPRLDLSYYDQDEVGFVHTLFELHFPIEEALFTYLDRDDVAPIGYDAVVYALEQKHLPWTHPFFYHHKVSIRGLSLYDSRITELIRLHRQFECNARFLQRTIRMPHPMARLIMAHTQCALPRFREVMGIPDDVSTHDYLRMGAPAVVTPEIRERYGPLQREPPPPLLEQGRSWNQIMANFDFNFLQ